MIIHLQLCIYICYDNCNCTVISICITNIQLHSSMLNIPIYQETVSGVGAHWRGGRRPGLEKLGIFRPCFWPSGCFNLFDILYSYGKSAFFMAGGWFIYIYIIFINLSLFFQILNINLVLDAISPIVGWCEELGHLPDGFHNILIIIFFQPKWWPGPACHGLVLCGHLSLRRWLGSQEVYHGLVADLGNWF